MNIVAFQACFLERNPAVYEYVFVWEFNQELNSLTHKCKLFNMKYLIYNLFCNLTRNYILLVTNHLQSYFFLTKCLIKKANIKHIRLFTMGKSAADSDPFIIQLIQ